MKKLLKLKRRISLLLLLTYILGIVSCKKEEIENNARSKDLTKEELFKQIILIEGDDIDKKIPEYAPIVEQLKTLTAEQKKARKIFNDYIVSEIKKNDPEYLKKLKQAVESKQLYTIKEIITEGQELLINTLRNSEEHKETINIIENFLLENQGKYNFNSENQSILINDIYELLRSKSTEIKDYGKCIAVFNVVAVGNVVAILNVLGIAIVGGIVIVAKNIDLKNNQSLMLEKVVLSIAHNY